MTVSAPAGDHRLDATGVVRDAAGRARYRDRPDSLVELLRCSVERCAEATAIVEIGGGRLTYSELWERAGRVAGGLRARGISPGDRVAIVLPNGTDWVLAFLGAQLAGAIAVPVNTRLAPAEVRQAVADSGAALVIEPGSTLPDGATGTPHQAAPDDVAAIFYTSGTTGAPKGAMTTHANFTTNSENAIRCLQSERDGLAVTTLVSVPLFHVTGCNSQLIPVLELGGTVAIAPRALDVAAQLEAIAELGVNHLVTVPAIYHALLRAPEFEPSRVAGVRWALYGGAPIAGALVERLRAGFPGARLGNGFGLTETASLTSFLPHELAVVRRETVGFPMPVVDLEIAEPDGDGVGELLVRGPNVVAGYWERPRESAAAFVDGWLRTGDLARIGSDGLLTLVDRKKDMINRGGENVYSIEVENALADSPGVGEAAVLPVADEMMGEKVGAVLVAAPDAELDVAAAIADLAGRLADFKVPQYVAVRAEPLPRNPNGKVTKARLSEETEWGAPLR